MLKQLSIKNYAIIEDLEVKFGDGVNILTGETGAGKSILLGALGLILGDRAEAKSIFKEADKCVIEGVYKLQKELHESFFEENELDFETETIVRREVHISGKSRAFINDTPVSLTLLKKLGEQVLHLHSQHETLDLIKQGFQLETIDKVANLLPEVAVFEKKYKPLISNEKKVFTIKQNLAQQQKELDFLLFQQQELNTLAYQENEQIELENEQTKLANVEAIQTQMEAAIYLTETGENAILNQLGALQTVLKPIQNTLPIFQSLSDRIVSVKEELKDILHEFETIKDHTESDPARLSEINERLQLIYKICKKQGISDANELLDFAQQLNKEINAITFEAEDLISLEKNCVLVRNELVNLAKELHNQREAAGIIFSQKVTELLHQVGMPHARFEVANMLLPSEDLNKNGLTEIQFLFSANKGFDLQPIKEVASGGELSRLMLCVKSVLAEKAHLPSLVFDEIDTGISGEVAFKVGEIMRAMSQQHQLICITHLPQIARIAKKHFYIYKDTTKAITQTKIKELNSEERVLEIAKMLSGENVSESNLNAAKELIGV